METFLNENALKLISEIVEELLRNNEVKEALNIIKKYFSHIDRELAKTILINESDFNWLQDRITKRLISNEDAQIEKNRIIQNLLYITTEKVPIVLDLQQKLEKLRSCIYTSTSSNNLERILGPINHLLKIKWLHEGIKASRSVCKVLRNDGVQGTGFLVKGGYLMTNCHVIPNKKRASETKIIFDYEEDLKGNLLKTSEFFLEPEDSKFSGINKLDYAYVKIKDNPANPLAQWGEVTLDTFSDPQINDPVTIIQHPFGQTKQIALSSNKITDKYKNKLFYLTDTERGSSGSPVFNNNWKVIALHHAGKTEAEGGLLINPETGERRGVNEGILIKAIAMHLGIS